MSAKNVLVVFCFLVIYFVWGSTFLAIRWAVADIAPLVLGALRFVGAGTVLFFALGWRHRRTATREHLVGAAFTGVLMAGVGNGLLIWAEMTVPSGTAALWIATVPICILLMNWIGFERRRPSARAVLGALVGVLGISLLSTPAEDTGTYYGALALLGSSLVWSFGTLYQRTHPGPMHPFLVSAVQMLAGGVLLLSLALAGGEGDAFIGLWRDPQRHRAALGALLYLTLVGSVLAFTAYSWLVKTVDPQKVATYALVNPIIALALGNWLAGEILSVRLVVVAALVIMGVGLILSKPPVSGKGKN